VENEFDRSMAYRLQDYLASGLEARWPNRSVKLDIALQQWNGRTTSPVSGSVREDDPEVSVTFEATANCALCDTSSGRVIRKFSVHGTASCSGKYSELRLGDAQFFDASEAVLSGTMSAQLFSDEEFYALILKSETADELLQDLADNIIDELSVEP